jgi:hypothetical protein
LFGDANEIHANKTLYYWATPPVLYVCLYVCVYIN